MRKVKGVGKNAKREREEFKKSGAWLHNSIAFDPDVHLSKKYKRLADELFCSLQLNGGYKVEQKKEDFEILLANLFQQTNKPISISMSQNSWKQTQYNKVSYFIVALVCLMNNKKLLNMKKGFYMEHESRMTRISATDKLLEAFPEYNVNVFYKPQELVILRDSKGKLKDYKETAKTWRIRSILELVNDINSKSDIRYQQYKLNAYLRAIFIEQFSWYGRLHTKGFMHYQGFWDKEREEITINGDSIIELDYSGMHPHLLYAAEGIQYSGDPYSILDKRPEARKFLKEILLCMLNAKDQITAERAANYWLHKNPEEAELLRFAGITKARPFIDRFMEQHSEIAKYFCQGKRTGMRIMNKDAGIALDVVNHFAKQNIPILPIHDSFIVQRQYRRKLYNTMQQIYGKHTGFRIQIK